jgi:hypothetical protein
MKTKMYEVSLVSGDAEANLLISASNHRDVIFLTAEKIKNKQVKWHGTPDSEWEFISVFPLEDDE